MSWSLNAGTAQASVRPAGGSFSAPVDLSAPQTSRPPLAAVDSGGNIVAAWDFFTIGSGYTVRAATYDNLMTPPLPPTPPAPGPAPPVPPPGSPSHPAPPADTTPPTAKLLGASCRSWARASPSPSPAQPNLSGRGSAGASVFRRSCTERRQRDAYTLDTVSAANRDGRPRLPEAQAGGRSASGGQASSPRARKISVALTVRGADQTGNATTVASAGPAAEVRLVRPICGGVSRPSTARVVCRPGDHGLDSWNREVCRQRLAPAVGGDADIVGDRAEE